MAIEVELRSVIDKKRYEELIKFFSGKARLINEDYQETHYLDEKGDIRIQRNKFYSKFWTKKGNLHDPQREEHEVKFSVDEFQNLESAMKLLGFSTKIKWLRNRHTFDWEGINVMVDYTKGYGYIIELERLSDEKNKDQDLMLLKKKFKELGLAPTPREELDKKYEHYRENWRKLIKE